MSQSRKRHIRERLRNVENTLNILNSLGLRMKALDKANLTLRYSHLSPLERYTVFVKSLGGRKPVHFHRHYTKVEIPIGAPTGHI